MSQIPNNYKDLISLYYTYDEELLEYYKTPLCVKWWNENKKMTIQYVMISILLSELIILIYITLF